MADVRVLHNGNTIAELSETGTKTAVIGGRYCKGDLEIDYTKPYGDPPSGIRITALPGKTHFRKGERIDYTGICVRAVRPDGTTFTDETYPDGRIPFAELVFPVEIAQTGHVGDVYTTPTDDSSGVYRKSGEVFSFQPIPVGTVIRTAASPIFDRTYTLTSAGAPVYACRTIIPNDYSYVTLSSAKTFVLHYRGKDGTGSSSDPYREHDETRTSIRLQCDRGENLWLVEAPNAVYYNQTEACTDMTRFGAGIPIPVRWSSPYTGAVLEDTFIINGETPDPTLTITQNGTYDVYDYSFAEVNVQHPLQAKTITQNGFFTPDSGYYGLSGVEINVPEGERGYELLEYIESNGTQGIDTGRKIPASANILCTFLAKSGTSNYNWAFGAEYTTNVWAGLQMIPQYNINRAWNGTSSGTDHGAIRYAPPIDCMSVVTTDKESTANLWIFTLGIISGSVYDYRSKIRLYYCKCGAWTFLPCRRKSDGVCGLWDSETGTFLTDSLGGDPFVAGPVVFG